MTRTLYRSVLWLHPAGFRRQFADEMLWIFDQAASAGAGALLLDGIASLGRQWLFRGRRWVMPAAIAGGLLQVLVVLSLTYLKRESRAVAAPDASRPGAALLEQSRAQDAPRHVEETPGTLRNLDLPGAPGTGDYAWPCSLLVLLAIVLIYSTPALRRPFPDRKSPRGAARRPDPYGDPGGRARSRPERPRPLSWEKAN